MKTVSFVALLSSRSLISSLLCHLLEITAEEREYLVYIQYYIYEASHPHNIQ